MSNVVGNTCEPRMTAHVSSSRSRTFSSRGGRAMRGHWLGAAMASALLAFGLAACGSGTPNSTAGGLQIWQGYTGAELKAFNHLLAVWNKAPPTDKVTSLFVNNDSSLPKLLTAVKGGSQ